MGQEISILAQNFDLTLAKVKLVKVAENNHFFLENSKLPLNAVTFFIIISIRQEKKSLNTFPTQFA